ncbi:hypothetical protein [Hydrogenibacillus sp. N12]|uniref:hypothetical protein n=1 Tax=Hydrogenibacillus sp. N12 TaxID=2866627 RepID=UPI001C7E0AEB|nr:hypothetical protein [Hydrogenibacillus sp. N12]QZA32958.1 hypothetical protein K2M58_12090 [Hydrogenibacillus sp. N12]
MEAAGVPRAIAALFALAGAVALLGFAGVWPPVSFGLALGAAIGLVNAVQLAGRVRRLIEAPGRGGLGTAFRFALAALGAALAVRSGGAIDVRAYAAGLLAVPFLLAAAASLQRRLPPGARRR